MHPYAKLSLKKKKKNVHTSAQYTFTHCTGGVLLETLLVFVNSHALDHNPHQSTALVTQYIV